ncbi:MAG: hypothetical protein ACRD03_13500 [Acidimicrobiales bacterium]
MRCCASHTAPSPPPAGARRRARSGRPSAAAGEPMARLCIVNPRTTVDDVRLVLDTL